MNVTNIGGHGPVPEMKRDPKANFAVFECGGNNIFIEKDPLEPLVESTVKWLTKNGFTWNDVKGYTEKILDPENVSKLSLTQGYPEIYIKYHSEDLTKVEINPKGNFLDLRAGETVELKAGDYYEIDLGISVKLPEGCWGQLVPRSSLFKKHGLLQTNSFGVIDTSYCGDGDHWKMPVYATRDTKIEFNERIAQFRIVRDVPFALFVAETLDGVDRGGFGSTGSE